MDIQPDNQQTISDDQELAKVLAGVGQDADDSQTVEPESSLPPTPPPAADPDPVSEPVAEPPATDFAVSPTPQPEPVVAPVTTDDASQTLDGIKQAALGDLRPLVDKLNVSPEEKFDTYLLLLRSTDDKDLIAPAYEAARSIADEAKRAQALLDIIKEIDFLSQA